MLADSASCAELEEHLEVVVNAFVDAWNERDSDKRMELLNASVALDGSLRDPAAVVVGRDEVSERVEHPLVDHDPHRARAGCGSRG